METPNDEAGKRTEQIIALFSTRCDDRHELRLTVGQHNALYEAIYTVIEDMLKLWKK